MFKNQTVIILGAGASKSYEYPTGEELVELVIAFAQQTAEYCQNRLELGQIVLEVPACVMIHSDALRGAQGMRIGWEFLRKDCLHLVERLQRVRPLVIDYFLAWNPSLSKIGKLMIAAVILHCESLSIARRNRNKQNWYRFIVHKLISGCESSRDIFNNKVRFVTFNYDTSLERNLEDALSCNDLFMQGDVDSFLYNDRIVHVYGAINGGRPAPNDFDPVALNGFGERFSHLPAMQEFSWRKRFLDRSLEASETLLTIDLLEKSSNEDAIDRAQEWIRNARIIYILGYGFDEINSRRLGLDSCLQITAQNKCTMFTNFEDRNTINKRASRLFFDTSDRFIGHSVIGDPKRAYVEKSVRSVYEALEKDFDSLEAD